MSSNQTDLRLRRARPEEADTISDLVFRAKAAIGYDEAFMEAVREELLVTPADIESRELWVAEGDGLLGCGALVSGPAPFTGEIATMFIEPGVKRSGIGSYLLSHLMQRAKNQGMKRLVLEAEPTAQPFYEKHGFEMFDQKASPLIPGRFLPLMERSLVKQN